MKEIKSVNVKNIMEDIKKETMIKQEFSNVNEEKRTCIYILQLYNGEKIVGKAKCAPEDVFVEDFGKMLAKLRAYSKYKEYLRSVIADFFWKVNYWTDKYCQNITEENNKLMIIIDNFLRIHT